MSTFKKYFWTHTMYKASTIQKWKTKTKKKPASQSDYSCNANEKKEISESDRTFLTHSRHFMKLFLLIAILSFFFYLYCIPAATLPGEDIWCTKLKFCNSWLKNIHSTFSSWSVIQSLKMLPLGVTYASARHMLNKMNNHVSRHRS